jgi:hypothetical protein
MTDLTGYGPLRRPGPGYRAPPPRVAQAAKKKPAPNKEPRTRRPEWKAVADGPHRRTASIYFLFYFGKISPSYSLDMFIENLHGSQDQMDWPTTSDFLANQVELRDFRNSDTAWTDLGNALHDPGAVVIYWGHSERLKGSKKARNLRPVRDSADGSRDFTIGQLKGLVKTMNAKCFILASCATDGCLAGVKRDTAIIATDSGKNLVTDTVRWTTALRIFLLRFIDGGAIGACLADANAYFATTHEPEDKFVLASGMDTLTLTS